ncbi:MAG: HAMP domain-containing sensor histidine kinase, partial [Pseudomonadota bacterium]
NASLSMYVVERLTLIEDGSVNQAAFMSLAEQAMTVNPSVEVYLLSPAGAVIAHALPEEVQHDNVPVTQLEAFLDPARDGPVLGLDPRSDRPKAFSASPIMRGDDLQGYLYVILGGQQFDRVQEAFLGTFIGRVAAVSLLVVLVLGAVFGLLMVLRITQPLKDLGNALEVYGNSGFTQAQEIAEVAENTLEVQQLKQQVQRMADQLATQLDQIATNDRLRRELLANVSHDLRTPLASMQGYLETLLIKDQTLSVSDRRAFTNIAYQHTQQLNRMVGDLFELAKLDSGAIAPSMEQFSLSELLQDVIQEFSLMALDKEVELRFVHDPSQGGVSVHGDISLLQRVFENLISNALRYTSAGGSIELSVVPDADRVAVGVSDSGSGIAPEVLPTIFDRLSRDPADEHGSGLGLAIVKKILDLHDSQISVRSQQNVGTTFRFELPTAEAA